MAHVLRNPGGFLKLELLAGAHNIADRRQLVRLHSLGDSSNWSFGAKAPKRPKDRSLSHLRDVMRQALALVQIRLGEG